MGKPVLLVLASTYPRWRYDPEPAFVHELCRRLASRFTVTALVPAAPGAAQREAMDGVEVIRYRYAPERLQSLTGNGGIVANLKRSPWKWLLLPGLVAGQFLAARHLMRARQVDILHAHWLVPQGFVARCLARRFGVPLVITSHGGDLFGLRGRLFAALKRHVAAGSDAMTVVSGAMAAESERLGLRPPRLEVIPMGVDLRERFTPDAGGRRSADELLFVGRLVAKKGLNHLLEALPAVLARRPSTRLLIAGFGPEQEGLRHYTEALGLAGRVDFLGAVSQADLPRLYRRAAAFTAPFVRDASGDQEGLPVALMEAIGCGCPAVVGKVSGIEDLLGPDAADVCVDPKDPDALAGAILAVLEHPESARERALAIRAALIQRIDWEVVAERYARLLLGCVAVVPAAEPSHP